MKIGQDFFDNLYQVQKEIIFFKKRFKEKIVVKAWMPLWSLF